MLSLGVFVDNTLTYSIPPKEGYSHKIIPVSARKYPTDTCEKIILDISHHMRFEVQANLNKAYSKKLQIKIN